LYPAGLLESCQIPHDRKRSFVFESEIVVQAANQGYGILAVPTFDQHLVSQRPSYFHPWLDISKITRMIAIRLLKRGMYPWGLVKSLRPATVYRQ
jgi:hypothetical protein